MRLKTSLSKFIVGAITVLAMVIGSTSQSLAVKKGGTLKVSFGVAATKLNPLLHRLNIEYLLGELLYSSLTRLGDDMSAEPDLAESWKANSDLSEWTFILRKGAKFTNGQQVTSKDVVATFKKILDPKTASPARKNVGPIADIIVVDETTVKFVLKGSYADLPIALAYTNARIIPASIANSDMAILNNEAIGTGPYTLKRYEPNRLIEVERNPNYFIADEPHLDKIEIYVYPDSTAEVSALINQEIDVVIDVKPADFNRLGSTKGVVAHRTPSGRFLDIVMNNATRPFNDKRVRQALKLSVDRKALIELVADGYGTAGVDTPINAAYKFHHKMPDVEYDPAKAKRLLADAGYPNGLSITLVASVKPPIRKAMAVIIRDMVKPAGFDIKVQTMAHSTYIAQVWKKGNFYVGHYNMQATADAIFNLLFVSDAAWNETKWNNKEFDQYISDARKTTDDQKRQILYQKAQTLMEKDSPAIIPVFLIC